MIDPLTFGITVGMMIAGLLMFWGNRNDMDHVFVILANLGLIIGCIGLFTTLSQIAFAVVT